MARLRADLHESWNSYPKLLDDFRRKLSTEHVEDWTAKLYGESVSKNVTKYASDSAKWEYDGEVSITTLEEALKFCNVDLDKYEPKTWKFGSHDVSMKVKKAVDAKTGKDILGGDTKEFDGKIIYVDRTIKRVNYTVSVQFGLRTHLEVAPPISRNIEVSVTDDVQMWVIIGCVHRPFHNKKLWDNFINFLSANSNRITGIIINGDYLDLRSLNSHTQYLPEGIDLSYEYSDGKQGISEIEEALSSDVRKIFHYGNHEYRYTREMQGNSKYGSALMSPEDAMLDDTWEVVRDYKDGYTLLGKNLEVFHGQLFGVNAAKSTLAQMPDRSCIFNHTHRIQSFAANKQTAWNGGWMGDVNDPEFKYMERRSRWRWQNGFTIAFLDKEGKHYVNQLECDNSKIFFEGKLYG